MVEIPSTSALLSFRAAARHLSFLQAANDRNVTPGAISRQIQGLEDLLGTRLFNRHHKRVELTAQGRDYLAEITTPLDHLAAATARIQGEGDSRSPFHLRLSHLCHSLAAAQMGAVL